MSNGNGRDKPLIGSTKGAKLTVSGILAALVGSGGFLFQQASSEITYLHGSAAKHELQNEALRADVDELKAEINRLEAYLVEKLEIRIPE